MVRKLAVVVCGMLITAGSAFGTVVMGPNVLLSGQSDLAIIDGDGNGPDSEDCRFQAEIVGSLLTIFSQQDMTTPLRACAGRYFGTVFGGTDSSSTFAGATIEESQIGAGSLPLLAEIVDEEGGPGQGPPIMMNDPRDYAHIAGPLGGTGESIGRLCQAGGLAAEVKLPDGVRMLESLSFYPSAQNAMYLKVPNLPFEQADPNFGSFVMLDGFIPVVNHHITMALASDPNNPIIDINLDTLAPCAARTAAPTLTEWGLLTLVLVLLVTGSVAIRRRPQFTALP